MIFKRSLIIVTLLTSTLTACSSLFRHPSSLDNNGDAIDDSFDKNLETYYGGSREEEIKSSEAVAQIIREAVQAQYEVRDQVFNSANKNTPEAQRIFKDLPRHVYATRDVHRKTNGCYKAALEVSQNIKTDLNKEIAQAPGSTLIENESDLGVFTPGAKYDAVVRLSNGHPGNRPDMAPDARGFAVKILPANTLTEAPIVTMDASQLNEKTNLDILTINFPTFFINDPVRYAELNRGAVKTALDFKSEFQSKAQEFASVLLTSRLNAIERRLTFFVNGSVIHTPLFQEYFSMVPSRLGPEGVIRAVKYSWVPAACSADKRASFDQESKLYWMDWTKDHSYSFPPHLPLAIENAHNQKRLPTDYLRKNALMRLTKDDFCFNLYFQVYRDAKSTNIEDSTDIWLRSEAERDWWLNTVVPSQAIWLANFYNTISRDTYISQIKDKKIAPPVLAARLTIKKLSELDKNASGNNNKTCEDLSYNPWHGNIEHHKPLGVVSRMKRKAYNASRRHRHSLNGIDDSRIERPAY